MEALFIKRSHTGQRFRNKTNEIQTVFMRKRMAYTHKTKISKFDGKKVLAVKIDSQA